MERFPRLTECATIWVGFVPSCINLSSPRLPPNSIDQGDFSFPDYLAAYGEGKCRDEWHTNDQRDGVKK